MPARTIEQLGTELNTIIDAAKTATERADSAALAEAHAALGGFMERLDARTPGAIALGDVAAAAMRDVTLARLDATLARGLALRRVEVDRIARMFKDAAKK